MGAGDIYLIKTDNQGNVAPKDYAARAQEIKASSYLSEAWDPNIYHPVKAFDGRKETGWFENKEDSGIGEYISISLDKTITVDKIVISHGWFESAYFWQNNRIKKLEIELGGLKIVGNFKDIMEPQEIKLAQPVTFNTARFIIKEVYKTQYWNDTAIAEVEFWYQGKKVEIDLGIFKEELKLLPRP